MSESFTLDPAVLWFIVGIMLIIAEFVVPGFVILFFGVGALMVALLCWMGLVDSLGAQLLWFSVFSLVTLFSMRWLLKSWFVGRTSQNADSDEHSDYIGKEALCLSGFSAKEPYGKVEFKGAHWKARCSEPLAAGDYAVIEAVDGLCLVVRPKV